jgi:thiamine pyrophosphate-dependent acetolactate synthase large subunit-like protein
MSWAIELGIAAQVNRPARSSVVCRADGAFLGSATNLVRVKLYVSAVPLKH